jgi:hypothetical protein
MRIKNLVYFGRHWNGHFWYLLWSFDILTHICHIGRHLLSFMFT